jgi:hypothetical protein
MYLLATTNMHSDDAETLAPSMEAHQGSDVLVMCPSSSEEGEFAWMSRQDEVRREGCGALSEFPDGGIAVAAHHTRIFRGDRTPYTNLIQRLPEGLRQGWTRETFDRDCRQSGAFGLLEEQEWCQTAWNYDGSPEVPTAYITHVLGSKNYFGFFNIYWEKDDSYVIKSCHDLRTWTGIYIPRMYAERDVERWVFLRKEDHDVFVRMAGDYRRAFEVIDFPFEVFQDGGRPLSTNLNNGMKQKIASNNISPSGGFRAALQAMLSRLGVNNSEVWTSNDQAVITRLLKVLTNGSNEPIDLSKAPDRLPKLKAVLLKRLYLNMVPDSAPTREEAIALYLDLSRFYANWDKLSCAKLFSTPGRVISPQDVMNCIHLEDGLDVVHKSRLQLIVELQTQGIDVSKLQ